jgi:hypothetical protein
LGFEIQILHPFLIPSMILVIIHSHAKNQVNISNHSEIKWSTKYLVKFQSPMVISWRLWPSYVPWTLKFGQIFSCHHFCSLCLEILTWFLVYECIVMSYRSSCVGTTRMWPPWILMRLANASPFFNSLSNTCDYTLSYQKSSQ